MPRALLLVAAIFLAAAAPSWPWRLAGIIASESGPRVALFAHDVAQGADTRALGIGDEIDGWTVAAIHRHDVVLRGGGQEMTLGLEGLPPEVVEAMVRARATREAAAQAVDRATREQAEDQATAETALARATASMRGPANTPNR